MNDAEYRCEAQRETCETDCQYYEGEEDTCYYNCFSAVGMADKCGYAAAAEDVSILFGSCVILFLV